MADHEDFHLPEPSGLPIVVSFGIALMLFGFVPDSRLWRLALVSLGATIALRRGLAVAARLDERVPRARLSARDSP